MDKKRFGFSLVELLIAIVIMGIMAATITLSASSSKVTAKSEAERMAAHFINLTHKFAKTRENFIIVLNRSNSKIEIERTDIQYPASVLDQYTFRLKEGCSFSANLDNTTYNGETNTFNNNGHITITDSRRENYFVYIYNQGGRIRISDTENED